MLQEIEAWVSDWYGSTNVTLTRMKGDASQRDYYRVYKNDETYVMMDSRKIEIHPFIDINSMLKRNGFIVPEIYHVDIERGWAIIEDLGNTRLLDVDLELRRILVEDALEQLAEMQRKLDKDALTGCVAGRRHFTESFFLAEMNHTLEHLFFRLLRVPFEELRELQSQMQELCKMAAGGARVFSHRDYHSSNIMVTEKNLVMLDWQDARMGPSEYDLVSLLRDSYYDIGPTWLGLAKRFMQSKGDSNIFRIAACACQRNLKAAGTFAYQYRAFGREHFLNSIPRTMRYLAEYATLCPKLEPLVDSVYHILRTRIGEIDLRRFVESDTPEIVF